MTENVEVGLPDYSIRFGYHGSKAVADRIISAAGYSLDAFTFSQYDVTNPFQRLRAGELDLMIVKFDMDEPDLDVGPVLAEDHRAAVLGVNHPLAHHSTLSIEVLAQYPSFHRPGSMPSYVWDKVVPQVTPGGRQIRRVHEVESVQAMMSLVAGSDAVHISLQSLDEVAPPSVRIVPIHDLPVAPVALCWVRGRVHPAAQRFLDATERSVRV